MLTEEEIDLLMVMNELYAKFVELPVQHDNDKNEFVEALHRLEHLVMIRPSRRMHPELFPKHVEIKINNVQELSDSINAQIKERILKNMNGK